MPSQATPAQKAAANKKKKKPTKFQIVRDASGVSLKHRGRFKGAGKRMKVKAGQDRRHLLHLDEHLKPHLAQVFSALEREFKAPGALITVLNEECAAVGLKRLPKTVDTLMVRIADEVNSSGANLVPDDAAINKAIELVRADLRRYLVEAATATNDVFMADGAQSVFDAAMQRLRKLADDILGAKQENTPIQDARDLITADIRKLIKAEPSPSAIHALVNDLTYSVTFDLSQGAKREQTKKVLDWQRRMASAGDLPAREQLKLLLGIIE